MKPLEQPVTQPIMQSQNVCLQLQNVHTHIERYHILQGVDLQVNSAEIVALLGRNGAGKTTTLRTIMNFLKSSSGNILFENKPITRLQTALVAQAGIAYVPENQAIFSQLSVAENMSIGSRQWPIDQERLAWILDLFPAIKQQWALEAGHLSGGQKQMLAIARAMIQPCKLLLVDEPSKGLSPAMVLQLSSALKQLQQQGTAILLVEQNIQLVNALADTVFIMDEGCIVHNTKMSVLAADPELQLQYLGLSFTELTSSKDALISATKASDDTLQAGKHS